MKYYYTDKQYQELVSNMVIQIDKREKSNQHIIKWLDNNNIQHMNKSFESGDYGFMIKQNESLGFIRDTFFVDELFLERKHDLDELANNFKDSAFLNEIKRTKNIKHKYIIIETGCFDDILLHKYQSQYNEKALYKTLLKIQSKYDIKIIFSQNSGELIYNICKTILDSYILK